MKRLGLKVVVRQIQRTTTSGDDLPSVREALLKLNNALNMLDTLGLSKSETLRLPFCARIWFVYFYLFTTFPTPNRKSKKMGSGMFSFVLNST
jgi:hypothetical protein